MGYRNNNDNLMMLLFLTLLDLVSYVLTIVQKIFFGVEASQHPQRHDPLAGGVRALILSPSSDSIERIRGLVELLSKQDTSAVAETVNITDVTWGERGGASSHEKRRRRDGPIVVASPAQLLSALNKGDSSLDDYNNIDTLVLDDIDKMLSTPVLQKILDTLKLTITSTPSGQQPPQEQQQQSADGPSLAVNGR